MSAEKERLKEDLEKKKHWRRWGPYLSEREWGTVREDYSSNGDVWSSFTFDDSKSRAYSWGEDGIGGICDNHQRLCFAVTLWNGKDPILKERLFGLSGNEGNHGEDAKEYYFYLDNVPTHAYMKYLYKYPQRAFPYRKLVEENKRRDKTQMEYELIDTGIFSEERYFDIFIEYAKAGPEDLLIKVTVVNRGPEAWKLHLLPTLWFRNTWFSGKVKKPALRLEKSFLAVDHPDLENYLFHYENSKEVLFTENETGLKDAFHRHLIQGEALGDKTFGTKAAPHYEVDLKPGESKTYYFRLTNEKNLSSPLADVEKVFAKRIEEAEEFYKEIRCPKLNEEQKLIQRQAFAGMLWNKQYYRYVVEEWLKSQRNNPRNADWTHLYNEDILSVPDKWEYPCYFSWDTAFHTIPLAMIDPEFAKKQLNLLTREWYMHPNGQIPSSEWSFCDVNPPVHAWATWRTYKIEKKIWGTEDRRFLEEIFQKLLLNFTWWVNRKDQEGKNIFQGGFLGMDNVSIFNRSEALPTGGKLYQSDASSWMGMYCLNMLTIALELARENPVYEDMASKFFEHFLYIADAIDFLWNEEDGFYYDVVTLPGKEAIPLKVRSMVGLVPLLAVTTASEAVLNSFKGYLKRVKWFMANRPDLCAKVASLGKYGVENRRLIAINNPDRLKRILEKMLDENEFLSPHGIRSLSKYHEKNPYILKVEGKEYCIQYEPAESLTGLFGGNSNWRGPIWFPLNMLIIEALQRYHYYYGDELKVECPTGSGRMMNLWEVSEEIARRLQKIFTKDQMNHRPLYGGTTVFNDNPNWKDLILFYECFHGDNGAGLGASHQTGWTGLIAKLIQQIGTYED